MYMRMQMQHVLADAILSFRLLKVGGLLIFDDMKFFPDVERATTAVIEALEGENSVEILHNEVRKFPSGRSNKFVFFPPIIYYVQRTQAFATLCSHFGTTSR